MRDPSRIPEVLATLRRIWLKSPDLRLHQLIGNVTPESDPYHVEDDVLLARLRAHEQGKGQFCRKCGAGTGPWRRNGEGTCPECVSDG
jgi:uncharacterized protein YihD (DUF1040 family)